MLIRRTLTPLAFAALMAGLAGCNSHGGPSGGDAAESTSVESITTTTSAAETTITPAQAPSATTTRGPLYGTCQVGGGECFYIDITVRGFTPGDHSFACFDGDVVAGKTWFGVISVDGAGNGRVSTVDIPPYCVAATSTDAAITVDDLPVGGDW